MPVDLGEDVEVRLRELHERHGVPRVADGAEGHGARGGADLGAAVDAVGQRDRRALVYLARWSAFGRLGSSGSMAFKTKRRGRSLFMASHPESSRTCSFLMAYSESSGTICQSLEEIELPICKDILQDSAVCGHASNPFRSCSGSDLLVAYIL